MTSIIVKALLLSYIHQSVTAKLIPKIVGGTHCGETDYPFAVTISPVAHNEGLCGASMVTLKWVLTAAHCIYRPYVDPHEITVTSSPIGVILQQRQGKKVVIHSRFNNDEMNDDVLPELRYDIALLLLESPFLKTSNLDVAKLPKPGYTGQCTMATAVGKGFEAVMTNDEERGLEATPMKCVNLHIVDKETCSKTFPKSVIDDSLICTRETVMGKDACEGDSGGPLVCNGVVIGIISYGLGCGIANFSATHTSIEKYLDFISETIQETTSSKKLETRNSNQTPSNRTSSNHTNTAADHDGSKIKKVLVAIIFSYLI